MPSSGKTKLTTLVRDVLSERYPLGAYEIASRLAARTGLPGYPNTVYRIIAPMVQTGEVICIASVKGWLLADRRWTERLVLLCRQCQTAEQLPAQNVASELRELCRDHNFTPHRRCLEVIGVCRHCCDDSNVGTSPCKAERDPQARRDLG